MSILSTNTKLIKVGQDYSAGSGISIEDKVISVTGGLGNTYYAGENISIYNQGEQLYISSKDWNEDIANASANAYNEAVAQIPSPFDPSFISGQVDNKLDTTAFTNWQNGQYSTDLQTIEGQISNKLDESAFSQVSGSFLTAINIPESATWDEVSQAYEQASATYLTSISIPESAVWQDVSTTVQTNSAQWAEGGGDMFTSYLEYNGQNQISGYNGSAFAGETLTGDAQGAVDTVYSTSGNIITGTKSDRNFTARNVTKVTFGNFTIDGLSNYIEYDRPGYPTYSWFISNNGFHLGPEFAKDYWENYARVWLERTGLSSMSGTKSDKKLIWRALLDNDVEGANNTITAIAGSALVGGVTGEFVPQSSFDELKASYDALSASYDALSSLFATYSGQWLLPNEGE